MKLHISSGNFAVRTSAVALTLEFSIPMYHRLPRPHSRLNLSNLSGSEAGISTSISTKPTKTAPRKQPEPQQWLVTLITNRRYSASGRNSQEQRLGLGVDVSNTSSTQEPRVVPRLIIRLS